MFFVMRYTCVETDCEPKIQRCSPSTALFMANFAYSILRPCISGLVLVENFSKLFPGGEHLCALLWFKYVWKLKIQECSPSTALVMVIPAFSILSPCIINWGKAENFLNYFQMMNTSVHCCEVSTCGNWLWAKNSEVFTLYSSSYGDFCMLNTVPLYKWIGLKIFFKIISRWWTLLCFVVV